MEFIDGVTLREKIHCERTELRKLLRFPQHAAEGLAKAHAAGIVRRDLKPDNSNHNRTGVRASTLMNSAGENQMSKRLMATAACHTDKGKVRTINEDASLIFNYGNGAVLGQLTNFALDQGGVVLAVADGMGGAQAGEIASQLSIDQLIRRFTAPAQEFQGRARLSESIKSANRAVRHAAREDSAVAGMGSTITAIFIEGNQCHIGQVGDSRAYLIRADTMRQLTKDQSLVQLLADVGKLTEEEANHSSRRNVILQALGAQDDVTPEMSELTIEPGDAILLCTDYLMQKVTKAEVLQVVRDSGSLTDACGKLVSMANERGGEDNITVLIAVFSSGSD
jgi:PPM family protein phosphatase